MAAAAAVVAPTTISSVVAGAAASAAVPVGRNIFVYNNIRTNQVVYSLTRSLKNTKSIKQLPFVGKNTVPRALRRDYWTPLCVLDFPSPFQGLNAYQKLREFKHLHEVAYDLETVTVKEGKDAGKLMRKKDKGKVLMNQKANSIADMAAVLAMQARPPTQEELERADRMVNGPKNRRGRPKPKRGLGSHQTAEVYEFRGKVDGVSIRWTNTLDAEYAETWPEAVQHGSLATDHYRAVWPPLEEAEVEDEEAEAEVEADSEQAAGVDKK